MDRICRDGELSLIYFDGHFSHAVRKTPKTGDFRVQIQFGGDYQRCDADSNALRLAETALATLDSVPLYARIDLVPGETPLLMELELIEPDLYLTQVPEQLPAFAAAIVHRLRT